MPISYLLTPTRHNDVLKQQDLEVLCAKVMHNSYTVHDLLVVP